METLDGSTWDVVIAGTGIQQSLLALALSRSGKKILHVDKNDYYGGSEAALSLQEAESWAKKVNRPDWRSSFRNASITQQSAPASDSKGAKLAYSRAYSLSLAPNLLHTRSNLLPALVSSRVHQQLEFQAVGSWFVYEKTPEVQPAVQGPPEGGFFSGRLVRVPNSREDIFADSSLNLRAKGALVKFLRFVATYEEQPELWDANKDEPFPDFLSGKFRIPANLHGPLLALTMSTSIPEQTTTGFALSRIAEHLRSIGLFGPGFSAVLPKWGGLSEIVQVACRAGAVGGAVYVLDKGVESAATSDNTATSDDGKALKMLSVRLTGGDTVTTTSLVGTASNLPQPLSATRDQAASDQAAMISRTISIVSSPLSSLFPSMAEGSPSPAGAIAVIPSGALLTDSDSNPAGSTPPIQFMIHSSDTGECASGQCVVYASLALPSEQAFPLLEQAVKQLLASTGAQPPPTVLWCLQYEQHSDSSTAGVVDISPFQTLQFKGPSLDPVYDEQVLDSVKEAWQKITDEDPALFLQFQEREEGLGEEQDYY